MKFTIENAIHIWYVTGYYNENEMLIDWYRFKGRPISEKGWQFRYAIVFTTLSPFFNNNIHPSIHPSIWIFTRWNLGTEESQKLSENSGDDIAFSRYYFEREIVTIVTSKKIFYFFVTKKISHVISFLHFVARIFIRWIYIFEENNIINSRARDKKQF